jgi:hypothetical protein
MLSKALASGKELTGAEVATSVAHSDSHRPRFTSTLRPGQLEELCPQPRVYVTQPRRAR